MLTPQKIILGGIFLIGISLSPFFASMPLPTEVPPQTLSEPALSENQLLLSQVTCPLEALKSLLKGNARYAKDKLTNPRRSLERRISLANSQTPFAIVLCCSDSRVVPEIIFDQGVGDLFVIRVAGNVVGPIELDSIEYAALHLKSCLIFVLGHENCGAVKAVLEGKTKDIEAIATLILPAVKASKNEPGDPIANAVEANVELSVEFIKKSPALSNLIESGKVIIVGGYYHLNGHVEILQ